MALYDRDRPRFVVYGVATDYCVRAAVSGLLDRGCRVAVVVDAIRAIDPAAEAELLTDFARRGALLILTDAVVGDGGSGPGAGRLQETGRMASSMAMASASGRWLPIRSLVPSARSRRTPRSPRALRTRTPSRPTRTPQPP